MSNVQPGLWRAQARTADAGRVRLPGLHFTVNPVHEPIVDDYLEDLARAVETAPARVVSAEENATY